RQERGLVGREDKGRSFREALIFSNNHSVEALSDDSVLQVEVDALVLNELYQSFVGVLALDMDVTRIRTTLYMEGRQHISVKFMGGKLILLHSPKVGELEALIKAKADWLIYYFKEVKPWSAELFNDKREVWVK
ncbi:hypothetical protein A2U01_0056403, partial [Trifolium medium]|nr:hypothetical protein [Trifolium medium]